MKEHLPCVGPHSFTFWASRAPAERLEPASPPNHQTLSKESCSCCQDRPQHPHPCSRSLSGYREDPGYGLSQAGDPAPAGEQQLQDCGGSDHTELQDLSGLIPGAGPPRGLIWHWVSWEGTSSSSQVGLKTARSRKGGGGAPPERWPCQSLGREGEGAGTTVSFVPLPKQPPCLVHPLVLYPPTRLKPPPG